MHKAFFLRGSGGGDHQIQIPIQREIHLVKKRHLDNRNPNQVRPSIRPRHHTIKNERVQNPFHLSTKNRIFKQEFSQLFSIQVPAPEQFDPTSATEFVDLSLYLRRLEERPDLLVTADIGSGSAGKPLYEPTGNRRLSTGHSSRHRDL